MMNVTGFSGAQQNYNQQQKQSIINQRYNEVYKHELAHKNAAGSFGGAIVIEKDASGIPIGGHVNIKMPFLDKKNPDKTISHADTVIKAAMAPADPSGQDFKVAAQARAVRAEAENYKSQSKGQKLNLMA